MYKFKVLHIFILCLLLAGCGSDNKIENTTIISKDIEKISEQQNVIDSQTEEISEQQNMIDSQIEEISEQQSVIDRQNQIIQEKSLNISELEDQLNKISLQETGHVQSTLGMAPNEKYASVILIIDGGARFAYLCNIETEYSKFIESKVPAQTYWSPDSKYFILDEGTGQSRWGNIYLTETCEQIDELRYRGVLYWLNTKEFIFVEENNDIKINTGTELDCTTNIIKYNVETREQNKLFEGNSDYYFYINMMNEDGTIKVSKTYINNGAQDK